MLNVFSKKEIRQRGLAHSEIVSEIMEIEIVPQVTSQRTYENAGELSEAVSSLVLQLKSLFDRATFLIEHFPKSEPQLKDNLHFLNARIKDLEGINGLLALNDADEIKRRTKLELGSPLFVFIDEKLSEGVCYL